MSIIIKPNGIIQQNHISYNPRYELPVENKSYYLNTEQLGKHIIYNTNNLYYSNTIKTSNTATKQFIFPHISIDANNVENAFTEIKDRLSITGRNLYQCRDYYNNPLLVDNSNQEVIDVIWNPCNQCYLALILRKDTSFYQSIVLQSDDGINWTIFATYNLTAFYGMRYWNNKIYFIGMQSDTHTYVYLYLMSFSAYMNSNLLSIDCNMGEYTYNYDSDEILPKLEYSQFCLETDVDTLCFIAMDKNSNYNYFIYGFCRLLYGQSDVTVDCKFYSIVYSSSSSSLDWYHELGHIGLINIGVGKYLIININKNKSGYIYYIPRSDSNDDILENVSLKNNTNYTMLIKEMSSINQSSKLGHVLMGDTTNNQQNYMVNIANNSSDIFELKTWQEPVSTTLTYSQAINTGGSSYLFNTNYLTNQIYCTSSFPYQNGIASMIARGLNDDTTTYRSVKFYDYDINTQSYLYSSSLKAEKNWQILDKIFVYARNNDTPGLYYSDIKM